MSDEAKSADGKYVIRHNPTGLWWRDGRSGYTSELMLAGVYTDETLKRCALRGKNEDEVMELAPLLQDVVRQKTHGPIVADIALPARFSTAPGPLRPVELRHLDGLHGSLSFSPTKGYSCSLLCKDRKQSWVTAQDRDAESTVHATLRLKEEREAADPRKPKKKPTKKTSAKNKPRAKRRSA